MASKRIGVIGGTGALGSGLALRLAAAGHQVLIGSRDPQRGPETAAELTALLDARGRTGVIEAADYETVSERSEIVIMAVRFAHQRETVAAIAPYLADKILIDTTVPLVPPKVMRVQLPAEGSAAQITQALAGDAVKVVSAFQSVAAHHLREDGEIPCDVIVTGDDKAAREEVIALSESIGITALHGGPLCNAAAAEALTSVLIFINKEFGAHSGIRITGVENGAVRA